MRSRMPLLRFARRQHYQLAASVLVVLSLGCSPNGSDSSVQRPSTRNSRRQSSASNVALQRLADAGAMIEVGAYLKNDARVAAITFENIKIDSQVLANVPRTGARVCLVLRNCQLVPGALRQLDMMQDLDYLYLFGTPADDSLLSELTALRQLREFYVSGPDTTGVGLQFLREAAALNKLRLPQTAVSDTDLTWIAELPLLAQLDIANTAITDRGLRVLGNAPCLVYLRLSDCSLTDSGLVELKALSGLESLQLDGTCITDAGIAALRSLDKLEFLDLSRTAVRDRGLREVGSLQQLQTLVLRETTVTNEGLAALGGLRNLRTLYLPGEGRVTKNAARKLLPRVTVEFGLAAPVGQPAM